MNLSADQVAFQFALGADCSATAETLLLQIVPGAGCSATAETLLLQAVISPDVADAKIAFYIGSSAHLPQGDNFNDWMRVNWTKINALKSIGARTTKRSFLSYETLDGEVRYNLDCKEEVNFSVEVYGSGDENELMLAANNGQSIPICIEQFVNSSRVTEYIDAVPYAFIRQGKNEPDAMDVFSFMVAVNRRYTLID